MKKLLLGLCLLARFSEAQENTGVEFKAYYGALLVHHYYMQHLAEQQFPMLELGLMKMGSGEKKWQSDYHFPVYGIKYIYTSLSSPRYLGAGHACMPYMSVSYIRGKKWTANFQFGLGLGLVQKPFDPVRNYKDIAIGSKLNAAVNLAQEIEYRVNDRLRLNTAISLLHFSNGSFKVPNLGLNLACLSVGTKYFLKKPVYSPVDTSVFNQENEISIYISGAVKEIYPVGGKKYPVCVVTANWFHHHSSKGKFGFSADVYFDKGIKGYVLRDTLPGNDNISQVQAGISFGYEFKIGRLGIPVMLGAYVLDAYKDNGRFYNKQGARFYFNRHWSADVILKTHFAKADFFQYGIGYRF